MTASCTVCHQPQPDFVVVLGWKYCRACASNSQALEARERVARQNVPALTDALLAEVRRAFDAPQS